MALFFDFEDVESWELLHPNVGRVARPDEELYELEDGLDLNTDAYWAEALREAGISASGAGSPSAYPTAGS